MMNELQRSDFHRSFHAATSTRLLAVRLAKLTLEASVEMTAYVYRHFVQHWQYLKIFIIITNIISVHFSSVPDLYCQRITKSKCKKNN